MRWIALAACGLVISASAEGLQLDVQQPHDRGLSGRVSLTSDGPQATVTLSWTAAPETPVTLTGRRTKPDTWWFTVPRPTAVAAAPTPGLTERLQVVTRATAGEAEPTGVTTARLNLRQGPGMDQRVVETVDPGTELELTGERSGPWRQLRRGGQPLWAHGNYLLQQTNRDGASLEISRRDASSYWAIVRADGTVRSRQVLNRLALRALLVNVGGDAMEEGIFLRRALDPLERYYRGKGYEVVRFPSLHPDDLIALLDREQAHPFTRVVVSTHSGWDGPIWVSLKRPDAVQIFTWDPRFDQLARALRTATVPEAKVYVSGCHAAGSNKHEPPSPKVWVRDLARSSGRTVGGPTGRTSAAEHTYRQTLAVLEGEGRVVQETVLVTPTEERRWGGGVSLRVTPVAPPEPDTRSEAQRWVDEDDAEAMAEDDLGTAPVSDEPAEGDLWDDFRELWDRLR